MHVFTLIMISFLSFSITNAMHLADDQAHKRARVDNKTDVLKKAKAKLIDLYAQEEPSKALVKTTSFDPKNTFAVGEIVLAPFLTRQEYYSYACVQSEPFDSADDCGPYGKELLIRTILYDGSDFMNFCSTARSIGKLK